MGTQSGDPQNNQQGLVNAQAKPRKRLTQPSGSFSYCRNCLPNVAVHRSSDWESRHLLNLAKDGVNAGSSFTIGHVEEG